MAAKLMLGFIGAGKMATALAKGFIRAGLIAPGQVVASDPAEASCASFVGETGANTVSSNREVLRASNVVILGVKPSHVSAVLKEIGPVFTSEHLLISIAAGVTLSTLESGLPAQARVIRVMPNTPALVGASASALAAGKAAQPEDTALAMKLFSAVGMASQVSEGLLDAVTGLSGSGPAFVYMFIEALSDGGVAAGLPRDLATQLAAQTVLGSARMVLETGLHPGTLKDMVTSPAGTTIQGVAALEQGKLRGTVINAVRAAADRARELGQTKPR
jgi:pyrroline-5-carboxylate reductase